MKLLRRTCHVLSIATLSMWIALGCAVATQDRDRASQPTPPRDPQSNRGGQPPGRQNQQPPTTDTRGSIATPFVVKVAEDAVDIARKQADRDAEASNKRWSLFLSVLTLLVLAFQVWLMRRQTKIMADQRTEAGRSAKAAEEQKNLMELQRKISEHQNKIGERQNGIMADQTALMDKQAELTRDGLTETRKALLLTHRPQLIVREIDVPNALILFNVGASDSFREALEHGLGTVVDLRGTFRVVNSGNADAYGHYLAGTIFVGAALPMSNPANGKSIPVALGQVPPGNISDPIEFIPLSLTASESIAIRHGSAFIYAIGKVIYKDALGNARRTGFARIFDMKTGRFSSIGDDLDYEYLD